MTGRVIRRALGVRSVLLAAAGLLTSEPALAGGLTFVEAEATTSSPSGALSRVVDVTVSADGAHLYAAVEGRDAVTALERDFGTGEVTILQTLEDGVGGVDGLRQPTAVAVTPDGDCVYVAGEQDDAVVAFARTPGTGLLTFVEAEQSGQGGVTNMRSPADVAVSPDSASVYVVSEQDNAVVVFARNLPDCDLAFVEFQKDAVGGVDGLRRPRAVSVSADGAHLYASGGPLTETDDAVAVFARDGGTGALTFLEHHLEGVAGVDGIATGEANVLSPDDRFLYVAGRGDKSIARFSRDADDLSPTYGRLTFVDFLKEGGDVRGLAGVRGLAMSPDGAYLYTVAGDRLATFRRDLATGALAFLELLENHVDGVLGLGSVRHVAVSPDAAHVYTAARNDSAIAAFEVDACGNFLVGPDEQCDGTPGCSAGCRLDLCPAAPLAGCRAVTEPFASLFLLKDDAADKRDKLVWKWKKGAATDLGELDDPFNNSLPGGDDYLLCLYDGSAAPQPLATFAAPAGGFCDGEPCWQAKPASFKYRDKLRTPDGLKKVVLAAGATGKAKITVNGKGSNLYFLAATPGTLLAPSGLTLPVTVQMTNSESGTPICWGAVYDAGVIRNDDRQFKAVGD